MRKKVFLLVAVLFFSLVFPSNLSISYAMEKTELSPVSNYYLVHYNGEEQSFNLNEEVILHLVGWTDEYQNSVQAYITDSSGDHEVFSIELSDELQKFSLSEEETVYYRIVISPIYKLEVIEPESITNQVLVVAENENGTSMEETRKVDAYGTVHDNLGYTYYKTGADQEKMEITKEDYEALSSTTEYPASEEDIQETEDIPVNEENTTSIVEDPSASTNAQARTFSTQSVTLTPSIKYASHMQDFGWQLPVADGAVSGISGQSKRMESISIFIENSPYSGSVSYKTHVQDFGWMTSVMDGELGGTAGESKRMEAIQISLTGQMADHYDIYYHVHVQDYGWLGWAKNGESSGTESLSKRIEAIEIKLVKKGVAAPGTTSNAFITNPSVDYSTNVQSIGWQPNVSDGEGSGTIGQAKRLEGIKISLKNQPVDGNIVYSTHIESYGWLNTVFNGQVSGKSGENKRMEAIRVNLTGQMANEYDVYYRVHAQDYGWLGWAKNGASAGTEALSKRLEAVEIQLVKKGAAAPGTTDRAFISVPSVSYSTHIENIGWQGIVKDGAASGTSAQALRLEAIQMKIENNPFSGNIMYSTHIEGIGWVNNSSNGQVSGTAGQSKRIEGIQISLTGEIAEKYDVYYRVHAQDYGWLGWAKNGMKAGTEAMSKRLEAIEVKLVEKGKGSSVSASTAFKQPNTIFLDPGHGGKDPGAMANGFTEAGLNLAVAKKVERILTDRGYTVYMARTTDTFVELIDRPKQANAINPDLFVSIHHNSSTSKTASGIETYFYKYDPAYPSEINSGMHNNPERILKSTQLANLIQNKMISYTGAVNRGVDGETFKVLRETAVPAVLLELGFVSNSSELAKLVTSSYQDKLAKAIADGITEYLTMH
ncbi:N-acetylmuramoyl-L-alanine amidase [Bacillus sp. B1-b2]|uniref:N-acetylmuramoyl-L-alanine amidase n=1 Tax=Bacillus sp. B1-b2 TaxID=2653201 RepID=UPI00186A8068|nr:N-acetylmuramoyl-L-alanine amidase [Bacillus sp. B1-b2]